MNYNNVQNSNNTTSESQNILCWYEDFKNERLPVLCEYAKVCDEKDTPVVNELITCTTELGTELDKLCDKEYWQVLPLRKWNEIYNNLNQKITFLKNGYSKIMPQIEEFEASLCHSA